MAPERLLIEPDDLTADFAESVIRQLQINQGIKASIASFFDIARKNRRRRRCRT